MAHGYKQHKNRRLQHSQKSLTMCHVFQACKSSHEIALYNIHIETKLRRNLYFREQKELRTFTRFPRGRGSHTQIKILVFRCNK